MFSSAPKQQQQQKKPIKALFSFCENILGCNLQRRKNASTFRADRLSKLKFILPRIYTGQKTESKSAWRLFFSVISAAGVWEEITVFSNNIRL